MDFVINNKTFTLNSLIDSDLEDDEVQKLLCALKANDPTYVLHEPMEIDKNLSNDNWSCHIAAELGITIEFVASKFCYICFEETKCRMFDFDPEIALETLLIHRFSFLEASQIAYISKNMIKNKLLPNRYTPILAEFR
jgi:hypothetical protein